MSKRKHYTHNSINSDFIKFFRNFQTNCVFIQKNNCMTNTKTSGVPNQSPSSTFYKQTRLVPCGNIYHQNAPIRKSLGRHPRPRIPPTTMVHFRMDNLRIRLQSNLFTSQTILVNER